LISKILKMLNIWIFKWMVKSQSTLTGREVTYSALTSVLQAQGNGLFSWTPVKQSFFDRHKGHRRVRPVLHYQRSVTNIVEYFMKHIQLRNWIYVWYITPNFNQTSKVMDQYLLHTLQQYKRNHNNCFHIKKYRKIILFKNYIDTRGMKVTH